MGKSVNKRKGNAAKPFRSTRWKSGQKKVHMKQVKSGRVSKEQHPAVTRHKKDAGKGSADSFKTSLYRIESLLFSDNELRAQQRQHKYIHNLHSNQADVLRVRTGGHIAFVGASLKNYGVRNLPAAVLINSLLSQKMVADKSEFLEQNEYLTTYMQNMGNTELFLAPFTAFNVAQISRVEWRNQQLHVLPLTRKDIRASCVRVVEDLVQRAPSADELDAMQDGTFKAKCCVHLGRYLTCIDDPAIIAWYLLHKMYPKLDTACRDRCMKGRLRQMLLGAMAMDDNILLNFDNLAQAFPSPLHKSDKGEFVKVLHLVRISYNDVDPEWVCSLPEVLIGSVDVTFELNCNMADLVAVAPYYKMKPIAYPELRRRIDVMFLQLDFPEDPNQNDLFHSLNNACLVNYAEFQNYKYEARIGPSCAKTSVPFLTFCAMCYVFYRPYVTTFVNEYSTGGSKRALMIGCKFNEVIPQFYSWSL